MNPYREATTVPEAIEDCFSFDKGPLTAKQVVSWVAKNCPNKSWSPSTIEAQLRGSCMNLKSAHVHRKTTPKILFYHRHLRSYEVYDPERHGSYEDLREALVDDPEEAEHSIADELGSTFALESHLRDYLAHNLGLLEPNLTLWESCPKSVEYVIGGRRIDILAKDEDGFPVIVELKLNRAVDRVIGQALLYRALVMRHLKASRVRIILVASELTEDLRIACEQILDVTLIEYSLSVNIRKIYKW